MDALAERGHTIIVLTSKKDTVSPSQHPESKYPIFRQLHVHRAGSLIDRMTLQRWSYPLGILLVFMRELWFSWRDVIFLEEQIEQFQPDVIYLGQIMPFSKIIIPFLAGFDLPFILDDGGYTAADAFENKGIWFKYVEGYASKYSFVNSIKPLVINLIGFVSGRRIKSKWAWPEKMQILFKREYNLKMAKEKGVSVEGAKVIHSGVNTDLFNFQSRHKLHSPILIILPGRIEPLKGQIDAARLLIRLLEKEIDAQLLLVGETRVESYYYEIEKEISTRRLENCITHTPMVTHEKLVELYHQADICFFPTYHKFGFSRTPLEAMACGCIVISYGNEGSGEVIRNQQNGFLVPSADYSTMVDIVKGLISSPELVCDITKEARREIEEKYSMKRYIDRIEEIIQNSVVTPKRTVSI